MPAGELGRPCPIFLRLVDLVLQRPALGGLQACRRWRALGIALVFLHRGDEEPAPRRSPGAFQHGPRPARRRPALRAAWLMAAVNRPRSRSLTAARIDLLTAPAGLKALRELGEAGHWRATTLPDRSTGGDRHRGMVEEAHEADFGGPFCGSGRSSRAPADHQACGMSRAHRRAPNASL